MNKNIKGKDYWRSLDQLADTPEFRELLHREFPEGASELSPGMNRRKFMTLMGASLSLAGLASCRRPVEKIIPYVTAPEEILPGIPRYFASTMNLGGHAYGVLVESHDGRPTKIEGNEKHPSSLGGTNSLMQAAILGLYDPDRSQRPRKANKEISWNAFAAWWKSEYAKHAANQGEGLAVLSESFNSPAIAALQKEFLDTFPKAKWYVYEPVSDSNQFNAVRAVSGNEGRILYHPDQAKVLLSIDADFLGAEQENVVYSRKFADGRRLKNEKSDMNRLYVVESTYTITGGMADHRKKLAASQMGLFVLSLAAELKKQGLNIAGAGNIQAPQFEFDQKWLQVLASDLLANRGKALLAAGRHLNRDTHSLVLAINHALAAFGSTMDLIPAEDIIADDGKGIQDLVKSINENQVSSLFILGGNPVYNAPADTNFKENFVKIANKVHFSAYVDETSVLADWHIPQSHFLEAWGDARALDGTVSVVQPLIAPLFETKSEVEFLGLLARGSEVNGYDTVRQIWQSRFIKSGFEKQWRKALHDGLLEGSKLSGTRFNPKPEVISNSLKNLAQSAAVPGAQNLEVVFRPSNSLYDGRFANNGWLQEIPHSITKLSWDNAAIFSHKTASELGLKNEDLVVLALNGREIPMPVWILPGQPDYSVSLELGYGRRNGGRIAAGSGFNAYWIRTSQANDFSLGLSVQKTIDNYPLANTQDHNSMEGRPIIREASLGEYRENPDFAPQMVKHPPLESLWQEHDYSEGYQWGMVIDLNVCTGCNACAIACQSENNVPIVGKEEVKNGREMHWLRMDRYFNGDIEDPEMVYQPMACQHCENAPCEQVCPVQATSHDEEGLNVMTYNRCIGTRYCSNNCPYKVRRFNFFNYTKETPEIVKMAQNPDVSIRTRGVMEKCTYCTQRINYGKIAAKNENRELQDGEVISACQQSCPTNAITFGNINDPNSEVYKMKHQNRNYEVLAELNIQPRTSYLAKIRNPHPELI